MFLIALIIFLFIIAAYIAFAVALIYHVRAYTITEDPTHSFIMPLIIISAILITLSTVFFLQVPWGEFGFVLSPF